MSRAPLSLAVLTALAGAAPLARAETPPELLRQAFALQEVTRAAIAKAEPSVACVLVSRSRRYREFEVQSGDAPPGHLGAFEPGPFLRGRRAEQARRLDLSDPENVPESYGSGVVIDPRGLVLTCFHVIDGATKIYVRLPGGRGSYADVHAADGRSDLAVLRLIDPPPGLRAIPLGDGGAVRKGDWVLSLANPFASGFRDGSPSASWGIVANLRRRAPGAPREQDRTRTLHHYGTLIQTDARLNLGCSGGALLNLRGELVGLTTALAALTGGEAAGGYAVPMDADMRRIIDVLRQGREVEYGFLGVSVVPGRVRGGPGVPVHAVTPGSPAAQARLRPGDVILSVNGEDIFEMDDLFLRVGAALAGSEVTLRVRPPGGEEQDAREVRARLAKFAHPSPWIASNPPPAPRGLRVDYASTLLADRRADEIPAGVLVRGLEPDSPAEAALKKLTEGGARLVITSVNGRVVTTPEEFRRTAGEARGPLELTLFDADRLNDPPKTVRIP